MNTANWQIRSKESVGTSLESTSRWPNHQSSQIGHCWREHQFTDRRLGDIELPCGQRNWFIWRLRWAEMSEFNRHAETKELLLVWLNPKEQKLRLREVLWSWFEQEKRLAGMQRASVRSVGMRASMSCVFGSERTILSLSTKEYRVRDTSCSPQCLERSLMEHHHWNLEARKCHWNGMDDMLWGRTLGEQLAELVWFHL